MAGRSARLQALTGPALLAEINSVCGGLGLQHAAELQRMASGIAETIDRRTAFISLFLDPSVEFYESVSQPTSGQ